MHLSATVIFLLVMFFAAMIRHCALAISADNDMTPDYFLTWRMTESHVEMVECWIKLNISTFEMFL